MNKSDTHPILPEIFHIAQLVKTKNAPPMHFLLGWPSRSQLNWVKLYSKSNFFDGLSVLYACNWSSSSTGSLRAFETFLRYCLRAYASIVTSFPHRSITRYSVGSNIVPLLPLRVCVVYRSSLTTIWRSTCVLLLRVNHYFCFYWFWRWRFCEQWILLTIPLKLS